MAGKGSDKPSEAELERRDARFHASLRAGSKLGQTLIVSLCIVGCCYFGIYLPVKESHGESTTIKVIYNFLSDIKANVVLSWTATAAAGTYAWQMRRKMLREREAKDRRIRELERHIDQKVTSSELTPEGDDARRFTK